MCGRCTCINSNIFRKYRWQFPFKILEIAKLYLKAAEIMVQDVCGIYEIHSKRGKNFTKYSILKKN
jgi:hypothetical protein